MLTLRETVGWSVRHVTLPVWEMEAQLRDHLLEMRLAGFLLHPQPLALGIWSCHAGYDGRGKYGEVTVIGKQF